MSEKTKGRLLLLLALVFIGLIFISMLGSVASTTPTQNKPSTKTDPKAEFDACVENQWCKYSLDEFVARYTELKWTTHATSRNEQSLDCEIIEYTRVEDTVVVSCKKTNARMEIKINEIYPKAQMPDLPKYIDPDWENGM